jgi:outer membrane protein assembly factor BamA
MLDNSGQTMVILLSILLLIQHSPAQMRLTNVQVKGNQRFTLPDIEKLTGLEIGKAAGPTDLTDAASKLAKTGLFSNVKYTYTTAGTQLNVTFEVEEAPSNIPAIFDNFVWMSDADLKSALREYVPEFDGTTTVYAGAADLIVSALQNILTARSLPGRVAVMPESRVGDGTGVPIGFVFTVADPAPQICAVHVSGASAIPEKDLVAQLAGVVGGKYSRVFLREVSAGTLTDMYHRKGHWRAAFDVPSVALNRCNGVDVTLSVAEGSEYAWDQAIWSGNTALPSAALDKFLTLKHGETADSGKLDLATLAIRREYGKHGYVDAAVTYKPQLDDAAHRATFAFNIREGAEYTMGTLQFVGISDADAARLSKEWRIKPGDVFDVEYMYQYQDDVLGRLQSASGKRPVIQMVLDRDHHVANLRVDLQ